jgi:4-amino-4-deoxy-L-arabinose transferase-like glycosyltransferase
MFVVPAALGRLGYPANEAAYAVNALYQILCFALVTLIGSAVTSRRDARALGWILQLLPIAFVFRVRANQEYAVLAGVLFTIYATERARTQASWALGMIGGFCAVLLVKGVFAVMVPIVCIVWLVSRATANHHRFADRAAWAGIVLMPVAGALLAWGYETAYAQVTGQSFLAIYQGRQLPEDAIAGSSPVVRTLYTASWYATRVAWYGFPWSVIANVFAVGSIRRGEWWPWSTAGAFDRGGGPGATAEGDDGAGRQGAWFAFVAALALTAAFSLAHRKADRYIFPVYFLIAAAGAGTALRRSAWLARAAGHANRPWVPAAFYVVLVVITMLLSGKLPQFTFWRT